MPAKATYLALGDSYTIGEGVDSKKTWPYLIAEKLAWNIPKVIAQTGWKTYELIEAFENASLDDHYDWVTLLIGVNNQYRDIDFEIFKRDLKQLSARINALVKYPKQVVVLSIPDYSMTPFVADKDRQKIADELASYNQCKEVFASKHGYQFCDITQLSLQAATQPGLVGEDKLHPSAEHYRLWALHILQQCNFNKPS